LDHEAHLLSALVEALPTVLQGAGEPCVASALTFAQDAVDHPRQSVKWRRFERAEGTSLSDHVAQPNGTHTGRQQSQSFVQKRSERPPGAYSGWRIGQQEHGVARDFGRQGADHVE
jgi:hypothetical protein